MDRRQWGWDAMRNMSRFGKRASVAAFVAAFVAAGLVTSAADSPDNDPVTVVAEFTDASPLVPGNMVKAAGVQVGEINSIKLANGKAQVVMELDRAVLPLHKDARAVIKPVSLLGERYVAVERGTPSAAVLAEPLRIPARRTSTAVDLYQVLNAVDDPTGTAMAALVTTLGEGQAGQGRRIAEAIKALRPAMTRAEELGKLLDQQNAVLTSLIDRAQPIARALAGTEGRRLDRLVRGAEKSLTAVAARQQALSDSLRVLPATLAQSQRTLGRLAGVAHHGADTLASMRPTTTKLSEISGELRRFAAAADPALARLQPVLDRADALLAEARPLMRELRPGAAGLREVGTAARPIMSQLSNRLRDVLDMMKFWSLATNGYDGLSHYFRGYVVSTPKALTEAVAGRVPQDTPALPKGLPELPSLPDVLGQPGPNGNNATGLSEEQEKSLVDHLLGGG